jgi:hypothetical protein
MSNINTTGQVWSDKFAGQVEKAKAYAQRILSLANDSFEKDRKSVV